LGIGIVKALVDHYSARVVVVSRNTSAELASLPPTSLLFIQCDIREDDTAKHAISKAVEKFGRLDSMVLNAGTLDPVAKLETASASTWVECFQVNLFANVSLV
jgi:NAD(P)-dependent dehydrogenase (short-subunit alcohol dehydrogenase family)